ncbi:hypothetical protein ITJ44_15520 [Clavibacter sp. VKM Ac-2873]|uniref:hypothetical protein n=1 Tax=Clavibacter sp. VKM Ac-2873 TaxID=2783813 RepID=UPI00188BAF39|nr:hypothetical protein [Clavibacter sp. VKM Ac-2873]MBF4619486.1 hypothetical protein [Clavibacter sp. VKM Ac-2873]
MHARLVRDLLPGTPGTIRDVDVHAMGTGSPQFVPDLAEAHLDPLLRDPQMERCVTGLDVDVSAVRHSGHRRGLPAILTW